MKIMVTGSRYWTDAAVIESALAAAIGGEPYGAKLFVGDCPTGADAFATRWWTESMGPATLHVARSAGPRAYQRLARNQLLVDCMPDLVLGYVLYGPRMSRGTHDTLNRAREAGLYLFVQERPAPQELLDKLGR